MTYKIQPVEYSDILEYWGNHLWVNRKSPIEPRSAMRLNGGIDMSYMIANSPPVFFAAIDDTRIIGVNSGHPTGDHLYRSRGLWVDPDYRNQGIGQNLIETVRDVASDLGYRLLWSLPRESSLRVYERVGFTRCSKFIPTDTSDNNCYAICPLRDWDELVNEAIGINSTRSDYYRNLGSPEPKSGKEMLALRDIITKDFSKDSIS